MADWVGAVAEWAGYAVLIGFVLAAIAVPWKSRPPLTPSPSPRTPVSDDTVNPNSIEEPPAATWLTFGCGDGLSVWKINGYDQREQEDVDFLVVCEEDAASVMSAISQLYPLKDFTIRGMKMLEGSVECIQTGPFEEFRLKGLRTGEEADGD